MQTFMIFSRSIVGAVATAPLTSITAPSCGTLYQYMNWFMIFTTIAVSTKKLLNKLKNHLHFISAVSPSFK